MKNIMTGLFKILLIGVITTISRIIGQLLIPTGEQTVLPPSAFVLNGTMPLVFTLYGTLAYSLIAAMFLLLGNQLTGTRVMQGLKYGIAYSLVWSAYLLEPLPHVAPLDRITYPLADSFALLVMGLLAGLMLGRKDTGIKSKKVKNGSVMPVVTITLMFIFGRLIQYYVWGIYSSFEEKTFETIAWSVATGLVISCVLAWLNEHVQQNGNIQNAFVVGGLLFGLNLLLFNFFMPLAFDANLPDLLTRTAVDIAAVTMGCLSFGRKKKHSQGHSNLSHPIEMDLK